MFSPTSLQGKKNIFHMTEWAINCSNNFDFAKFSD